MARRHLIRDPTTERLLGIALFVAGSYLLWDAWEARGRPRPFVARFLPS